MKTAETTAKYYTPEIESIHVGFEYEHWNRNIWAKCKISGIEELGYFIAYCEQQLIPERIRVKYLDQEDIEAEGWDPIIPDEKDDKDTLKFKIDDSDRTLQVWYRTLEPTVEIKQLGKVIFWGTIRNRSELKRIMQQLGIK